MTELLIIMVNLQETYLESKNNGPYETQRKSWISIYNVVRSHIF